MVNFVFSILPYCKNMVQYHITKSGNMVILPNCYHIWHDMVNFFNHITKYSNLIFNYLPHCQKYGKHITELPNYMFMELLKCYHISTNIDFIENVVFSKLPYYILQYCKNMVILPYYEMW